MKEDDERFVAFGDELLGYMTRFAGLSDVSNILDVGSGYGRLAHALLRRGTFRGSYLGIDILRPHITWCKQELETRRVRFELLDVKNDRYNPTGSIDPGDVRFPARDGWADVVVLFSVFTHMFGDDIRHYLTEIARTLRPEGAALVTFLLLDDVSESLVDEGRSTYKLPYRPQPFMRVMSEEDPLHAVAYRTEWVCDQIAAAGLVPELPPLFGTWSGRTGGISFQDMLVLRPAR